MTRQTAAIERSALQRFQSHSCGQRPFQASGLFSCACFSARRLASFFRTSMLPTAAVNHRLGAPPPPPPPPLLVLPLGPELPVVAGGGGVVVPPVEPVPVLTLVLAPINPSGVRPPKR